METKKQERMPTAQAVATLWMRDIGVSDSVFSVSKDGDVTYKGRTLTHKEMTAAKFGSAFDVLRAFVFSVDSV